MSISSIYSKFAPIKPLDSDSLINAPKVTNGEKKQHFAEALQNAFKEVEDTQKVAEKGIEDVVLGRSSSPHEAMLALEKADIAFQLMSTVKSKIIRAYEEIIRTQI